MEPVTEDEYKEAVKLAEIVVSWVDNLIAHNNEFPSASIKDKI